MRPFNRRWLRPASLLLVSLSWCASPGQQLPSSQDLTTLSIEDLAQTKVFTASLHMQDTLAAPSAVTVITGEEIRKYGWRTLADILNSVRSFYTSSDRAYTYLGVRGFERPGDFNSRLLLLIDGHRMNDNIFDQAMIGSEFPLDIDLISRIEIVRGPSSSLYGTNAFFGVVNVITRLPSGPLQLETSGDVSSYMSRTGRMTLSGQRDRFSGLVSGTLDRSAGNPSIYFPEFDSPLTNDGFATNVDGQSSASGFADFQYGDLRLEVVAARRQKILPTAAYGSNFNDAASRIVDTREAVDISYHHRIESETDLALRGYYDLYSFRNTYAFGGTDPSQSFLGNVKVRADSFGLEAIASRYFGRQRITAGSEFEKNLRLRQAGYYSNSSLSEDINHTTVMGAVFGQAEIRLTSRLTANAGARLDWSSVFGTAFSPRAALIFSPDEKTSIKYVFGSAFRAPNAYESYFSDDILLEQSGPLKPESIRSHEIIFEQQTAAWLRVTANVFYNNMNHLIALAPDVSTGLSRYENVGSNTGRGAELEIEAKRKSGLGGRASYTLSDGQDGLLHRRLSSAPIHLAKLNASLPIRDKAFLGAEVQYTSPQRSYQDTRVSNSLLANFTLSTKPMWGGFEVSASCYNCLDRRWFSPGTPELVQRQIIQDGRTLRFKIARRFVVSGKRNEPK